MTEKTHKGRGGRRHRLIYNNDRGFLGRIEPSAGLEGIVEGFLGMLRGTHVDTLVARICRGNLVPLYDSEVEGKFGKGMTTFPSVDVWRHVTIMRRLLDRGIDPYAAVFEKAREAGMSAFAGIRMNDLHYLKRKAAYMAWRDFFVSDIARDPRYQIGGGESGAAGAIDTGQLPNFLCPEVREHRFRIMEEICRRYDIDGLEIDFLRHCIFFPESGVKTGMPLMTELLRRVRAMMDVVEKERNHPVCLMARVPSSLKCCHESGLDVRAWAGEGLVDILGPCNITNAEFQMPVDEFVELADGTPCEIVPTLEPAVWPPYTSYLPEMARAAAAWYYHCGADGIGFFNDQAFLQPCADRSSGVFRVLRPEDHRALYDELHDPELMRFLPKRYVVDVTMKDKAAKLAFSNREYPKQLPLEWRRDGSRLVHSVVIKMAEDIDRGLDTGVLKRSELWIRISGMSEEDRLEVAFNGHRIPDAQGCALIPVERGQCLAKLPISPGWIVTGANRVEVSFARFNDKVSDGIFLGGVEVVIDYATPASVLGVVPQTVAGVVPHPGQTVAGVVPHPGL